MKYSLFLWCGTLFFATEIKFYSNVAAFEACKIAHFDEHVQLRFFSVATIHYLVCLFHVSNTPQKIIHFIPILLIPESNKQFILPNSYYPRQFPTINTFIDNHFLCIIQLIGTVSITRGKHHN